MTTLIRYKVTGSTRRVPDFTARRLVRIGAAEVVTGGTPPVVTRALEAGPPVVDSGVANAIDREILEFVGSVEPELQEELDSLSIDSLRELAEQRGIKVHHRAGRDKILAALRGED